VNALRVAVVGAGTMGALHAEKVAQLAETTGGVALAGVADPDVERARRVAARWKTRAAAEPGALFGVADAAIVAVPSASHFEVARSALEAGLDVLVEKPIAATLAEGEALLALAGRRRRILQVGHSEWFNAAMRVARARVRGPRFVEARRLAPFLARAAETDVVRDLMIHDLAILQQLVGEEPERVDAVGVRVVSDRIDVASARLRFPGGCVANLTASRVATRRKRKLRIFQADGCLAIDLLAQSGVLIRPRPSTVGGAPGLESEKLAIGPEDALLGQLRAFVESAATRVAPAVSAREALAALRTASRVLEAMPPVEGRR
jgi:predicted dehydrogenase